MAPGKVAMNLTTFGKHALGIEFQPFSQVSSYVLHKICFCIIFSPLEMSIKQSIYYSIFLTFPIRGAWENVSNRAHYTN